MNNLNKLRGGKEGPGAPFNHVMTSVEDLSSLDFWYALSVLLYLNFFMFPAS